jgi:hypothetical protein
MNTLKSKGPPRIEPCGSSFCIFSHVLTIFPILICCFLLDKISICSIVRFFDNIFDHFLCAFRKGHGCQTTLLRLLEDWKQASDCNIGNMLTGLLLLFKKKIILFE